MGSLELKVLRQDLNVHLRRIRVISRADRNAPRNKGTLRQQTISANHGCKE